MEYWVVKKTYEITQYKILLDYYDNPCVLEMWIFEDELLKEGPISEWAKRELSDSRWRVDKELNNTKKCIKLTK